MSFPEAADMFFFKFLVHSKFGVHKTTSPFSAELVFSQSGTQRLPAPDVVSPQG